MPDDNPLRLFSGADLAQLEHLTLMADSVRVGVMKGDRRSRKRGTAIEFADYRNYTKGDDLRRLDWNVLARLEKPFIKVTEEEEDLAVHVLVDVSRSMNWPPAEDGQAAAENKLRYALRLAGALGTIGLQAGDFVHVNLFDSRDRQSWGPFRGRPNSWPLVQFLEANYAALLREYSDRPRQTSLELSLRAYAQRARRPGLLLLLSDMLSPGDTRAGLDALLARGYEIALLHLLSPDEINPEAAGDFRLIDVETGQTAEITLDALILEEYAQRVANWRAGIEAFCRSRSIHYTNITTDTPWAWVVQQPLRRQGVVR
jgi:uncharacterized protein (DUF58 family)